MRRCCAACVLHMWINVTTWTSLCEDADVTCCLIWSCVALVPMATHSSSQRAAAALCGAEVRTGNVEQLSQLRLSIDIQSIPRC